MQLLNRKSSFNFYESFSDLIFCTLVLFLVLVLFLALNVDQRVEGVKVAEQDVLQEQERVTAALRDVTSKREEIEKLKKGIREAEREVELRQTKLDRLLGTRRFTGRSGTTYLLVAIDYSGSELQYYLVPVALEHKFRVGHINETQEDRVKRESKVLAAMRQVMADVGPLSVEQMRELFHHIRPYCVQDDMSSGATPLLGVTLRVKETAETHKSSNEIIGVFPGSVAAAAGIQGGDTIVAVDGVEVADGEALKSIISRHSFGDTLRVTVLRETSHITRNAVLRQDFFKWEDYIDLQLDRMLCMVASEMGAKTVPDDERKSLDFTEMLRQEKTRQPGNQARGGSVISSEEWDERWKEVQLCTMPTLVCRVDDLNRQVRMGSLAFSPRQFGVLLQSIGGRGVVIEFEADSDGGEIPDWVTTDVLVPSGYINRSPLLPPLRVPGTGAP